MSYTYNNQRVTVGHRIFINEGRIGLWCEIMHYCQSGSVHVASICIQFWAVTRHYSTPVRSRSALFCWLLHSVLHKDMWMRTVEKSAIATSYITRNSCSEMSQCYPDWATSYVRIGTMPQAPDCCELIISYNYNISYRRPSAGLRGGTASCLRGGQLAVCVENS